MNVYASGSVVSIIFVALTAGCMPLQHGKQLCSSKNRIRRSNTIKNKITRLCTQLALEYRLEVDLISDLPQRSKHDMYTDLKHIIRMKNNRYQKHRGWFNALYKDDRFIHYPMHWYYESIARKMLELSKFKARLAQMHIHDPSVQSKVTMISTWIRLLSECQSIVVIDDEFVAEGKQLEKRTFLQDRYKYYALALL